MPPEGAPPVNDPETPPPVSTVPGAPPPRTSDGATRVVVGLLLVVPALLALLVSYVLPTLWTLTTSFQRLKAFSGAPGEPVGTANYSAVAGETATAMSYALSLAIRPLLVVVVVAPLLALAAHHAGKAGRWVTRLAVTFPMVAVTPAALAAGWRLASMERNDLGTVAGAQAFVSGAVWLSTFGLACGVGVTLFLATLRRTDGPRPTWPAGVAVGVVAALATLAVVLQSFTYPMVITGGGPKRVTETPVIGLYRAAFQYVDWGTAAASSTILGLCVGALGLVATAVVLATRMRVQVTPATRTPGKATGTGVVVGWIATGVGLIAVLAVTGYGLWPWLSHIGGESHGGPSTGTLFVNTWLPPLVSTMVGVGLAAVAGFGIGALRPLGRFSELLLLPFAPWLLVGTAPLVVARFDAARTGDRLNSFLALVPPVWLVIPALFVFTLLAAGQSRLRKRMLADGVPPSQATRRVLLPALPMVVLVGAATWLWQSQDLLWQLVIATSKEWLTGPVQAITQLGQYAYQRDTISLGAALPIPVLVVAAVALAVLQLLHLDRLSIRIGRDRPPSDPPATDTTTL